MVVVLFDDSLQFTGCVVISVVGVVDETYAAVTNNCKRSWDTKLFYIVLETIWTFTISALIVCIMHCSFVHNIDLLPCNDKKLSNLKTNC